MNPDLLEVGGVEERKGRGEMCSSKNSFKSPAAVSQMYKLLMIKKTE